MKRRKTKKETKKRKSKKVTKDKIYDHIVKETGVNKKFLKSKLILDF